MNNKIEVIRPNWDAPKNVHAFTTTRKNGKSLKPFDSLNLGTNVNDDLQLVEYNRELVQKNLKLPEPPIWLNQTHSNVVYASKNDNNQPNPTADASVAFFKNKVCAVLTADCVPILVCNTDGTKVAAIHAGWRGLLNGIIENTIEKLNDNNLLAWIGPSITKDVYIVDSTFKNNFTTKNQLFDDCFTPTQQKDKWHANLKQIAKIILQKSNVLSINIDNSCTYQDNQSFFSHKRDGQTGRISSIIWFE